MRTCPPKTVGNKLLAILRQLRREGVESLAQEFGDSRRGMLGVIGYRADFLALWKFHIGSSLARYLIEIHRLLKAKNGQTLCSQQWKNLGEITKTITSLKDILEDAFTKPRFFGGDVT